MLWRNRFLWLLLILKVFNLYSFFTSLGYLIQLFCLGSTPFGSNENLSRCTEKNVTEMTNDFRIINTDRINSSPIEIEENEPNNEQNKQNSLLRLTSIESEQSDASPCNVSDAGSLTVNPVFGARLCNNSFRSTCSDSDIEVILVSNMFYSLVLIVFLLYIYIYHVCMYHNL